MKNKVIRKEYTKKNIYIRGLWSRKQIPDQFSQFIDFWFQISKKIMKRTKKLYLRYYDRFFVVLYSLFFILLFIRPISKMFHYIFRTKYPSTLIHSVKMSSSEARFTCKSIFYDFVSLLMCLLQLFNFRGGIEWFCHELLTYFLYSIDRGRSYIKKRWRYY